MRGRSLILVLLLVMPVLSGQGIRDSVFALEPVMITARQLFAKEEAGMKETRIDTAVLRAKVSQSLSDLLSENTTLFIKNHGRGALATASFRGTAASHTRVTWNGISLNSPMAGMVDFSLIPVSLIDNLSVRHGGASLKDGGGGIGGSVNLSNHLNTEAENQLVFMQGLGSYSTFDEFLLLSLGKGKFRSRTRLYHSYSRNDYPFVNRHIGNLDPLNGQVTHPLDTNSHADYRKGGLLQELYFRPAANHMLSLFYWGQSASRSIPNPTSFEGPDNSNLNRQSDLDHRLVTRWNHEKDNQSFMVRAGYARKTLFYRQLNRIPGLGTLPVVWSESTMNSLYSTGRVRRELAHAISLEVQADWDVHHVRTRDTVTATGYERLRHELSLMLAASKGFGTRFNLNLMLTQNWTGGKRSPLVPFLGMDLRLLKDRDLFLRGSASGNFHQPGLNDLYWVPGGNPGLKPEQGHTLESGLEYSVLLWEQQLQTGLTAYRSRIRDWILWVPTFKGYWEPVNIREVLSTGMEYDLSIHGRSGKFAYRFSGNYAYTRSVNMGDRQSWGDASHGKQLVYVPLHSGNALVRFSYGHVYLTYQFNAYGERYTTSSNDLTRRDWLYPYFMNDLGIGGRVEMRRISLEAELKAYNLFDEVYHSILYRPMPGRNYHLLVRIGL